MSPEDAPSPTTNDKPEYHPIERQVYPFEGMLMRMHEDKAFLTASIFICKFFLFHYQNVDFKKILLPYNFFHG